MKCPHKKTKKKDIKFTIKPDLTGEVRFNGHKRAVCVEVLKSRWRLKMSAAQRETEHRMRLDVVVDVKRGHTRSVYRGAKAPGITGKNTRSHNKPLIYLFGCFVSFKLLRAAAG